MHPRVLLFALTIAPSLAFSFDCIEMPDPGTQVSRDVRSDISASVGRLGPVTAGEISVKTEVEAKNLLSQHPDIDDLILKQLMISTYCSMLRESTAPESEKIERWEKFQDKILNLSSRVENESNNGATEPSEPSTSSILPSKFGSKFEEISSYAKLSAEAQNTITYDTELFGETFTVYQDINNNKTGMALLKKEYRGTHKELRDLYEGSSIETIERNCSTATFSNYLNALSETFGLPKGSVKDVTESEPHGTAGGRYEATASGAYWKNTDGEKILLLIRSGYSTSIQRSGSIEYLNTNNFCVIRLCAIPSNTNKTCFKIPNLLIVNLHHPHIHSPLI